jgi:hypothetical protein
MSGHPSFSQSSPPFDSIRAQLPSELFGNIYNHTCKERAQHNFDHSRMFKIHFQHFVSIQKERCGLEIAC